jgi:nucleotide-binding universal stress UspA family protein
MKRIIVPIDFSAYSENAFLSAVLIASKGNASITCVNVVASELDWKNLPPKKPSIRRYWILKRRQWINFKLLW